MIMTQMCEKYNRYLVSKKRDILICLYIGIQVESNVPQQEQSEGREQPFALNWCDRYQTSAGQKRTPVQDWSRLSCIIFVHSLIEYLTEFYKINLPTNILKHALSNVMY